MPSSILRSCLGTYNRGLPATLVCDSERRLRQRGKDISGSRRTSRRRGTDVEVGVVDGLSTSGRIAAEVGPLFDELHRRRQILPQMLSSVVKIHGVADATERIAADVDLKTTVSVRFRRHRRCQSVELNPRSCVKLVDPIVAQIENKP